MAARERLKNLLADALRGARADHTEIRVERTWATAIAFRGSRLEAATTATETGGMVRCLNRGKGWGIASFTGLDRIRPMVARAHELSLAVPLDAPLRLADVPIREANYLADLDGDVRDVPLIEKRALLERLTQEMLGGDRRIVDAFSAYHDRVTERWIATSDGVMLYDISPEVRFSAGAVAREESGLERAVESWAARGGWRSVHSLDHVFRAAGRRAVSMLSAQRVKAGTYPVVLDPRCMGVLVHQTIGHLSEADAPSAQGAEESGFAQGRRIASDLLTVGDDGSAASLPGSLPFDDEGAPTQNTLLVQHGVVVGRLHTRETAGRAGVRPSGNARAGSFRGAPAARLTNTYVSHGRGSQEDLIAGIRFGVYLSDAIGGTLHHGRYTLTAGSGHLIRDGRLAEPVRPAVLVGDVTDILLRIDAVGEDFCWNPLAAACSRPGSGRLPVSDGAPHVRFDGLTVMGEAG